MLFWDTLILTVPVAAPESVWVPALDGETCFDERSEPDHPFYWGAK